VLYFTESILYRVPVGAEKLWLSFAWLRVACKSIRTICSVSSLAVALATAWTKQWRRLKSKKMHFGIDADTRPHSSDNDSQVRIAK